MLLKNKKYQGFSIILAGCSSTHRSNWSKQVGLRRAGLFSCLFLGSKVDDKKEKDWVLRDPHPHGTRSGDGQCQLLKADRRGALVL